MLARRAALEPALGAAGAYPAALSEIAAELGEVDPAWFHEDFHIPDKEAVFAAARDAGRKIDAEGVVAASRLYTPPHIVAFLLQNSLAARWLEMHPDADRPGRWPLLVRPALRPGRPAAPLRDLRLLDPCCGCGAFLIRAFDLLVDLYREERRLAREGRIPARWAVRETQTARTIVERNLHGADLDDEAVEVAAGLLRARAGVPGVRMNLTVPSWPIGSLATDTWPDERFDVVCTNPPYVGFRMLAPGVRTAVRAADPLARSDLALAFQSRCVRLLADGGLCGTVTPASWLTGREALPLREHILAHGGPRVSAALGQRVFDQAPLLFVGLSVVERGSPPSTLHVLRPPTGSGEEGLAREARAGGSATGRATIERLPLRPFLPAAPPGLLALAGRGPRVGDLFSSHDGLWTGSNARDTRYWWEVPPGDCEWRALSGGQGHEPWAAPTRLRIRREHAAAQPPREGGVEYARVAGGRLAGRLVAPGTAALAGIVTLVPRTREGDERLEEVLAIFNSRVGTAWLRTLTSGLNFNPGYAAQIPLGRDSPPPELREAVWAIVALRRRQGQGDPTSDSFVDTRPPWAPSPLPGQITELVDEVERLLAVHLGLDRETTRALEPVIRPARPDHALDDHLMVRALRALGFRWPGEGEIARAVSRGLGAPALAARICAALRSEQAPRLDLDLEAWVRSALARHHARRFRGRPAMVSDGVRFRLIAPRGSSFDGEPCRRPES